MKVIKQIHVYAPKDCGIQDVWIVNDKIAAVGEDLPVVDGMEVIDGKGKIVTPGFLDRHVHVIGGGGEGGFATRTPEITLSSLIQGGITGVVGLLGTDGIGRSMEALLAKVKALRQEGISAWAMSGSYAYPSATLCGDVERDLLFVDEILGVKLALSDHRSSHITYEEFLQLASKVHRGGLLSGKASCLTLHMGDEAEELSFVLKAIRNSGLPYTLFHPTHVTRNIALYQRALQLLYMGGTIDITSEGTSSASWIKQANPKDYERITLSSDGQGSWSRYDESGKLTAIGVSHVSVVLSDIQAMIREQAFPVETCLSFVTSNVAKALGLYPQKGCIQAGSDADLLIFDEGFQLLDVMAKGTWLMRKQQLVKKGYFE